MRFGSRAQRARSALQYARLSANERAGLRALAEHDELRVTDYVLTRIEGVLYADNGYGMTYDLTNRRNIDADSAHEAAALSRRSPL